MSQHRQHMLTHKKAIGLILECPIMEKRKLTSLDNEEVVFHVKGDFNAFNQIAEKQKYSRHP